MILCPDAKFDSEIRVNYFKMRKTFLRIGSLMAMGAVILGAFGSHGLKSVVTPERLAIFEIGVRYQFYHALGLLAIGIMLYFGKKKLLTYAGYLLTFGIFFFSGSLYLLSFQDHLQLPMSILGPVTPIGGTLFIAGWLCIFISTFQHHQRS